MRFQAPACVRGLRPTCFAVVVAACLLTLGLSVVDNPASPGEPRPPP